MVRNIIITVFCLIAVFSISAFAEEQEKSFNLKHSSLEEQQKKAEEKALENAWSPLMPSKTFEIGLTLGFLNINDNIFNQQSIIYKYNQEWTYFGDVILESDSVFNPTLYLTYDIYPWFSIEGALAVGVSEYNSTVSNAFRISNLPGDDTREDVTEIGEFDEENRSFLNIYSGLNAMFYPPDYGNFGKGHWHPYIIGGVGRNFTSINSDYADNVSGNWAGSVGGGLRYIADDLISIRLNVTYNISQIGFDVKDSFITLDEGTVPIPIVEYINEIGQTPVFEYEKQTIGYLNWALGFYADF